VCGVNKYTYLEALGLLSDLHDVLAPQLPLPPLIVFQLVGELRLVLGPNQVRPRSLDRLQVPELQLLHRLVLSEQHGVLQVLLCLPLVELLRKEEKMLVDSNQISKINQTHWSGRLVSLCVTEYLSGQILLHVVSGDEDPAFEASTLQLQVLPLPPQQVGLLLRLGIKPCSRHRVDRRWELPARPVSKIII